MIETEPIARMNDEFDPEAVADRELLERFRGGEQSAAYEIYARYATRLLRLAEGQTAPELRSRMDPEDVVQSVFRTFFRRVTAGQYEVPEGEELWKLLLVMTLNKLRSLGSHHRAVKRDIRRTASLSVFTTSIGVADRDDPALQMLQWSIADLLEAKEESHRQIIELRMAGEEVQAIADKTGRSKRTIERVLQQFRADLLKQLGDIPESDSVSDD